MLYTIITTHRKKGSGSRCHYKPYEFKLDPMCRTAWGLLYQFPECMTPTILYFFQTSQAITVPQTFFSISLECFISLKILVCKLIRLFYLDTINLGIDDGKYTMKQSRTR